MVLAILAGRKTQTRRVLKPRPYVFPHPHDGHRCWNATGSVGGRICISDRGLLDLHHKPRPDDLLWVRETWTYINHQTSSRGLEVCIAYNADGERLPNRPSIVVGDEWRDKVDAWPFRPRKHPSIHMPRWASRITLKVTGVKVERLRDISESDAVAEGIEWKDGCWATYNNDGTMRCGGSPSPIEAYRCLWTNINGTGSWESNPWVAAISFERVPASGGGG
jgi:hypothetical protein